MEERHRHALHGALTLLGLFVVLLGLCRGRLGATVIGLIVAGVNGRQWARERRAAGQTGWW